MPAAIVNCDWGTSRLRVRVVRLDRSQVTAEYRSLEGVASLAESHSTADRPAAYRLLLAEALRPLTEDQPELLAGAPILVSGMASSSIGWHELPYAEIPLAIDGQGLTWQELDSLESQAGPHRVLLISGVRSQHDVLRGEETELIGLFTLPQAKHLAEGCLVIKPGTHSKHMRVQNAQLVDFQTFMTGELFDLLTRHSILQHSTQVDGEAEIYRAPLIEGVRLGSQMPLPGALFRVRTRQLLAGHAGAENRSFLSGILLGAELSYLAQSQSAGVPLVLCASSPVFAQYESALTELGLADRLLAISPEETELLSARGQAALWRRIESA